MSNLIHETRVPPPPPTPSGPGTWLRRGFAVVWLSLLFLFSRTIPSFVRAVKPLFVRATVLFSRMIRDNTRANAGHIFGRSVTAAESREYALGVVSHFYDFVHDVGRCARMSREELGMRIGSVRGMEHYTAARARRCGAIVLTAHMGSFEVGMVGLMERESRIHVVFKRDDSSLFERIRHDMRMRLGVLEAPIDEGWTVWMRLRDALANDEIVVAQGDRVLPGQKGASVPFLGGHLLIPTGPIKLALASGAPIVPIFTIREPDARIRVCIEPAITVEHPPASGAVAAGVGDPTGAAILRVAEVLAKYVRAYPEQWLVLHKAFQEDALTNVEIQPAS